MLILKKTYYQVKHSENSLFFEHCVQKGCEISLLDHYYSQMAFASQLNHCSQHYESVKTETFNKITDKRVTSL